MQHLTLPYVSPNICTYPFDVFARVSERAAVLLQLAGATLKLGRNGAARCVASSFVEGRPQH